MECETKSWSPAISEIGGLHKGLGMITLQVGGEMRTFNLLKPVDDDGTDISLKDWECGSRNPVEREPSSVVYPVKSFKGISVRTKFSPIEPRLDENLSPRQSSPDRFESAPTTPSTSRTSSSSGSVSPTRLERKSFRPQDSPNSENSSLQLGISTGDEHNTNVVSGIASSKMSLNDVNLDNRKLRAKSDRGSSRSDLGSSRSDRGSSMRVSFEDVSEIEQGSSTPRNSYRSLLRSRTTQVPWNDLIENQPKWESSTKIRPQPTPMPKKHVQPTLHGVRPRKVPPSAIKSRCPPSPLPEIVTVNQSNGMSASRNRGSQVRRFSLGSHSISERNKFYDASSNFISSSPGSPYQSEKEDASNLKPVSPSFLLRSNARRQHDDEDNDEEDVKVRMLCGGGLTDSNVSGDFVRLLSKLCRVSVPTPKQSASKSSSQQSGRKFERSFSTPRQGLWETHHSTMRENYAVLGRHASLKLLSERCSNGPTPAYNMHKLPRKIRDHEPHQHFYKSISKALDQKLKS